MDTFDPRSTFGNTYVPQFTDYQLEPEELKTALSRRDTQLVTALNYKTNGIYETVEVQTGEQFFGNPDNQQKKRYSFRKVIQIPANNLPIVAGGPAQTFPHGITGVTLFTHLYGVAVTATDWRPIPNSDIKLVVTSTQITITNEATSANITSGIVILEYIKQ